MTIRDPEVLDVLREEPELLAIADALAETQRPPRSAHRRGISRGAALVAVGAAALVAVLLWPGGSGGNQILDRALAAVEDRGPVLHAVFSVSDGWRVDLATGKTGPRSTRLEVWYDNDHRLARLVATQAGQVVSDRTFSGGEQELDDLVSADIPLDEADHYRDALASGKAKLAGKGTWRRHSVYWLELSRPELSGERVGVDRTTYRPVVVQSLDSHGRLTGREVGLLDLEYLPRREHQFGRVSHVERGGATAGVTSDDRPSLSPARAGTALGVRAAWAGRRLKGFPLQRIAVNSRSFQEGRKPEAKGASLQLVYGPDLLIPGAGGKGVEIVEMAAQSAAWSEGLVPPAGFVDLDTFEAYGFEDSGTLTVWTALLRFHGVWVRIEAPTRELAVAAARARCARFLRASEGSRVTWQPLGGVLLS